MSRFVYVNGHYRPYHLAFTHIEDRGYQFSDAVYEVICLVNGQLIDMQPHLDRLSYSLKELQILPPLTQEGLSIVIDNVIQKNKIKDGMLYIQVSRGIAQRSHPFPLNTQPVLVVYCRYFHQENFMNSKSDGIKVICQKDSRWSRPDIKSTSLLPNILSKQEALDHNAHDVIFLDSNGYVTESTSSNVWIVNNKGSLQTHPATSKILKGITRGRIISIAYELGVPVCEVPFTLEDLYNAQEAFLSSSVAGIIPIAQVDQQLINPNKTGTVCKKVCQNYIEFTKNFGA